MWLLNIFFVSDHLFVIIFRNFRGIFCKMLFFYYKMKASFKFTEFKYNCKFYSFNRRKWHCGCVTKQRVWVWKLRKILKSVTSRISKQSRFLLYWKQLTALLSLKDCQPLTPGNIQKDYRITSLKNHSPSVFNCKTLGDSLSLPTRSFTFEIEF